jgi:hypothetical protein
MLMPAPVKLVTVPPVVIRPIEFPEKFVNQSAPSGPVVIPPGLLMPAPVKLVTVPPVAVAEGAAKFNIPVKMMEATTSARTL